MYIFIIIIIIYFIFIFPVENVEIFQKIIVFSILFNLYLRTECWILTG